jgi:AhpD family alkylhydroperoxidase
MTEYHYEVDKAKYAQYLGALKKDLMQSFADFDGKVFEEGAIPQKYKELIAVASAHITRCPYCIDGHTRRAKDRGATDEEIAEAIFIAAAMSAGASIAHGAIAM